MADEIEVPEGLYAEIAAELEAEQGADDDRDDKFWLSLAQSNFDTSTDYLDSNIRQQWEKSIAHQNNEHAPGSKYLTDAYRGRSKLFRPKTRTNNQSAEAAFAKAMFSTSDLVSITPEDDNNKMQAASAEVLGYLMQHRLSKSIKWYMTCMGAYQDARVYGVCASYQYWDYEEVTEAGEPPAPTGMLSESEELDDDDLADSNPATDEYARYPENNMPTGDAEPAVVAQDDEIAEHLPDAEPAPENVRVLRDKPACDLLPPENIRFEPNADWRDPINTSPYVVRMVPMYANEAQYKAKGNGWTEYSLAELVRAGSEQGERNDVTRKQRQGENRQDPADQAGSERNEFTLIWLHENFVRIDGQDYVYWTCGTSLLLSEPVPIEDVYPHLAHGERPITLGVVVVESHRNYPNSPTYLFSPLQENSNDIGNQRIDNVRLVLNKRYIVKRQTGQGGIDLAALARSVPGGSVMAGNPETDVRVLETNDVTSSSYQEQDRLDLAIDELSGTFSQQTVQNNRNLNETVGGMEMMNAGASDVTEYAIRTFIETWVEPTLSQLVRLEQYYETDETIMALAAKKSEKFQDFGEDAVTDEMLRQELTVNVNAGFGKTDPQKRLNSLNLAMQSIQYLPTALARVDEDEVIKEVFGNAGFRDGKRFFKPMDEFKEEQKGQQSGDPVKMKELDLKAQDMKFKQQMEQQRFQAEQQRWEAELKNDRELELMKLAESRNMTLAELKTKLDLKAIEDRTKRDVEAGNLSLKQADAMQKQQNMENGYDTFG